MGPSVCNKLTDLCADLTDVTLADEDTNSSTILIICQWSNLALMQVGPSGGHIYNFLQVSPSGGQIKN